MTNGVSTPFESGHKTARLVEAATMSRGSKESREYWDSLLKDCSDDEELKAVFESYRSERDNLDS